MGQIKTKKEVELNGLDDIKKVLNVTLGSAFKQSSRIITNDDGLQYLDTLKDSTGRMYSFLHRIQKIPCSCDLRSVVHSYRSRQSQKGIYQAQ